MPILRVVVPARPTATSQSPESSHSGAPCCHICTRTGRPESPAQSPAASRSTETGGAHLCPRDNDCRTQRKGSIRWRTIYRVSPCDAVQRKRPPFIQEPKRKRRGIRSYIRANRDVVNGSVRIPSKALGAMEDVNRAFDETGGRRQIAPIILVRDPEKRAQTSMHTRARSWAHKIDSRIIQT